MTTDTTVQPDPTIATSPPEASPQVLAAPNYENYWGTDEEFIFTLPDGHQSFTIKAMDEGAKSKFQKRTNKGIRVNQNTQDAHLDVDPAGERHELILESVVDYTLMQLTPGANSKLADSWSRYPVSNPVSKNLRLWLERANPKTVQDLEFFIRKNNPWMQEDMDVEEIDKEIARLEELRKQVKDRAEGEGTSANK